MQFELKGRNILLEEDGKYGEVSPLPGRSQETLTDAIAQLKAVQQGYKGPLLPSVAFGLYGLKAPRVSSIPCALFLYGTPDEVLKTAAVHTTTVAKLKVGHWSVETALAVIRLLPFQLRLDFNFHWSENNVEHLCAHLDPSQIEFLEDAGCTIPGFTHASDEKPSPSSLAVWKPPSPFDRTIWKPMVRGLPPPNTLLILSSSMESSIGLHQIATLLTTHQIPSHILGIGTVSHTKNDLVQNPAYFKDGHLHFPPSWLLK